MTASTRPASWPARLMLGACALIGPALALASTEGSALVLEHVTTADGLPQGTVSRTLQDSQGFVWIGTEDGLVRFDGHELFRYAYSRTARGGLPGNFIYDLAEDARHDLWIAIKDGGLARWNRASDTFTVYRHDAANAASLASDAARAVMVDAHGTVWVGTSDAGVDRLDPATGRFEHLRHAAGEGSLIDDRILTLATDRSGTVWVGTESGLDRWQPEQGAFAHFRRGNQISRILEDQGGNLWIGTFDAGLYRTDRDGHVTASFRHDRHRAESLGNDDVRAVLEDQAGHLWVGTEDGLDLLDRASGRFSHYRHDESDSGSLRDSYIMSLYQDESGLVWIGTRAGGVSRWNPHSWELGGHRPAWLGTKLVTAFADAPDNKVWIASLGGELVEFDGESGTTTSIDAIVGRRNAVGDHNVMSLRQDRHGSLWIGTMASGLRRLTPAGQLQAIPARPADPHGLSAAGIMTIFEARDGAIWVGTHGGGANILDPATGLVRQLPHGAATPGAVSSPNVSAFAEDSRGNVWIGTDGGGLDLARADGTVVKVFRNDPNDALSLPSNTVWALAVDAQDRVWVGTDGGGLALVSGSPGTPDGMRFEVVSRDQGLSNDTIYGVLADARGRIWLSSNAGLMRFDPETRAVKTYHREHGLQGEEFDSGAFHRLRDGRLCFGGPGGFNIFDPSRLTENKVPPRLALIRLEVLGVPTASRTPYWLLDRIVVDHRASIISLDFGALDFTSPKRNRLAYRMAGLTDRWIDLGTQRRVTLTNLDAGDHVLEVRAANADSVWSDTPLRLTIHRDPAPWRSPWAYAAYLLAALSALVYRLHRQRVEFRRIVAEQQRLESEVALRTRELVDTNHRLAEAAQAKSNFLDRMSHELRTPMNGVVGMTELLARTTLSSAQSRLTQTIRSSAQVLLRIVNDLLDLSKIQAGKLELEALPIDIVHVVEESASLFAGAAAAKGLELIVCPPVHDGAPLLGDPLRIRQILMNVIGNAVKFTAQGEVVITSDITAVDVERVDARFTVRDTGAGMDDATVARIFEPFSQADESTSRRFGGSGLGLAICRELAALLGGTIGVESQPGIGSTFTVTLPLRFATAAPRTEPPRLPQRDVRVLTRRHALAESLVRYLAPLGLTALTDERERAATAGGPDDLLIVDAGSHAAQLRSLIYAPGSFAPNLVVVASAAEAEAQELERLVGADAIVFKPIHRDALYDAVARALGQPRHSADPAQGATPAGPAGGGHVLLVEDEPVNAAVAQGYLAALGCTSVWVADGAEAVARNSAESFDLVLMDLSMPGMDGFATTALIRQRQLTGRRVPIVALTAHEAASYRETCLAAGMDDVLSKPYTLEQCAQLLRRWIAVADASPPVRHATRAAVDSLASVDSKAVAQLRKLRGGGGPDLYSRLVDLFRPGSADSMAEIRTALAGDQLARAAAVCHKLTSSAANVGALAFANDVRELGRRCRDGEIEAARTLFGQLEAALPPLIDELMRLQLKATA